MPQVLAVNFLMSISSHCTVLLFGALRDVCGADRLIIDIDAANPTVADVIRACENEYAALKKWTKYLRVAVNCEYVESDFAVKASDEIALLPPVAGG